MEQVFVHETTIVEEEYKKHIFEERNDKVIDIINENYHEIKRYKIKLPNSITLENVHLIFKEFEYMETNPSQHKEEIIIYIDLPPKQGLNPGRRSIPIIY